MSFYATLIKIIHTIYTIQPSILIQTKIKPNISINYKMEKSRNVNFDGDLME